MADVPQPTKEAPAKGAKPAKPKGGSVRPDLSTLIGIVLAMAGIIGGLILEKGSIGDIAQFTAALIVMGGTFGAVMVTTPLPVFLRAIKGLKAVFFEQVSSRPAIIEALIQYAAKARKNGIVSLETEASSIADPFLRKALSLAVDGTDLQELRKMMEIDITLTEQAAENEAKVWEAAGGYAPTIGIIGAVMGLIQVMKHLEDIKEVGHGIAVAFVATVYGVASANIFFLPAATKLKARLREAVVIKEMTLDGIAGIVEGLNPTLIRMKLETYNQEPARKAKAAKPSKEPAAKGAAPRATATPEPQAAKG
jgi:chemotaxis protein MotA